MSISAIWDVAYWLFGLIALGIAVVFWAEVITAIQQAFLRDWRRSSKTALKVAAQLVLLIGVLWIGTRGG